MQCFTPSANRILSIPIPGFSPVQYITNVMYGPFVSCSLKLSIDASMLGVTASTIVCAHVST